MDCYSILGIERNAGKPEIKRAYFTLVKQHSPDADPEGFKSIRAAYETLSDDAKRSEYDKLFADGEENQSTILRVHALVGQHKYKEVIDFLTAEIEARPESHELKLLLSESLMHTGKSQKAAKVCDEVLAAAPANSKALLLRADIASVRGHTTKAEEYFNRAIRADKTNPRVWTHLMYFLLKNKMRWKMPETAKAAMGVSEDIFKDDYLIYMFSAVEAVVQGMDGKSVLPILRGFTEHFTKNMITDIKNIGHLTVALNYFTDDEIYFPCLERILTAIENKGTLSDGTADEIKSTRHQIRHIALQVDKRIDEVFVDITSYFIHEEDDLSDLQGMECYIVQELPDIRKTVRILRNDYPEFYKMHESFYNDVLNEKKADFLENKYNAIARKMLKAMNMPLSDIIDDDEDGFFIPQTPFVRESPKIGRNEACPCGSGKKYKRCCG